MRTSKSSLEIPAPKLTVSSPEISKILSSPSPLLNIILSLPIPVNILSLPLLVLTMLSPLERFNTSSPEPVLIVCFVWFFPCDNTLRDIFVSAFNVLLSPINET